MRTLFIMLSVILIAMAGYADGGRAVTESAELSPVLSSPSVSSSSTTLAQFDLQFDYNAQAVTGALGNAGAVFIPTLNQFWTSRWATGRFHAWTATGTLIDSFLISGVTGTRGMVFDGQYVYHSINTGVLQVVDPATRTRVGGITLPTGVTARYVAFDPTADGGLGGFWVGNWVAPALNLFLVSRTGAQLRVITNTAVTGIYGCAYDGFTAGGPYLWAWSQGSGATFPQLLHQINVAAGTFTGFTFNVLTRVTTGGTAGPIAGGLFIAQGLVPGTATIGGLLQGAPDRLWGLELAPIVTGNTVTVTAPNGGEIWNVGFNYNIRWAASGNVNNVRLRYSTNNGTAWTQIVASVPASPAQYAWLVPNTPSTQCLVEVAWVDSLTTVRDVSNAVFTINDAIPAITVTPDSLVRTLQAGQTATDTLRIRNTGTAPLRWSLSGTPTRPVESPHPVPDNSYSELPKGAVDHRSGPPVTDGRGGPDAFGYSWIDSNEPGGPTFSWVDITTVGTQITGLGDDTNLGPYPLGFNFTFYGNTFNSIRVCSNGWFSFTSTSTSYSNAAIPTAAEPNNLLAAFWDDLIFTTAGTAHYYSDMANNRFIIQYTNVPHYGTTEPGVYTFQMILKTNGEIIYQYLDMQQTLNSATIGIENATGTIGLQVAFNQAYMQNNLAIKFFKGIPWLTTSPDSGTVAPGAVQNVLATFNATGLTVGTYRGRLEIASNAPATPLVTRPVRLVVGTEPTITVTSPNGGENWTIGAVQPIVWTQSLVDTVRIEYSTNNGSTWTVITTGVPGLIANEGHSEFSSKSPRYIDNLGTFNWTIPNTPSTQCLVKISHKSNLATFDVSNGPFTISTGVPQPTIIYVDSLNGANDTTALKARGYKVYYRGSGPQGTTAVWFQGNRTVFIAYNGPDSGYVAANYNVVTGTNTIDSWLVLPARNIAIGDTIKFFERSPAASAYPDSVRVMYSAVGDSVPEAGSWVELGRFRTTITGLWGVRTFLSPTAGTNGRFAIRYAVVNGGPAGANSDYMGIDMISIIRPGTVDVRNPANEIPKEFALEQNYPNPFNPTTLIEYALPQESQVALRVYDLLGRLVVTLREGVQNAGFHNLTWDGRNAAGASVGSGLYFYRIDATPATVGAAPFSKIMKMLLIK